jgi:DNA-binding MarR family transcriptional regulator
MSSRLQTEIKQTKPFESLEQEAMLEVARTAALLDHAVGETLRPYGITATQYNVLRILRGAGPEGLCRNEVRDRLLTPVPDATRLLDRLMAIGLVSRHRDSPDKRFVTTRITPAGVDLLARLDEPIKRLHRQQLGHLGPGRLRTLIDLLEEARRHG